MSDEPGKHTRAWFLWALVAVVFVAYLISVGPVGARILASSGNPKTAPKMLSGIYAPVGWLCSHSNFAHSCVLRYMRWWKKL